MAHEERTTEERIAELEIRLTFQTDLCKQLDEVVREFAERVERLELKLEKLKEETRDQEPIGPHLDPPPHY